MNLTRAEENELLKRWRQSRAGQFHFASLEHLVASPRGFGLDIDGTMSKMQRALCRIIEGASLGEYVDDEDVAEALGMKSAAPYEEQRNGEPPSEVVVLAAVRTAKSLIAAATAVWAAQKCVMPTYLREGEIPRYSILSLELDNAKVVLAHLLGALSKPDLQGIVVDPRRHGILKETGADVVGSAFIRHPTGRPVELRVIAGKRAGGSLVSRWSIGATLDEAPRMVGSAEGVVNYDDAKRAVRSRLLPGAQILSIGSPWQPFGPIYDIVQNEWGSPSVNRVVFRARGPQMNPVWWNDERCAALRDSRDYQDRMTYQTDVLAEFADEEETLFPQSLLAPCVRTEKTIPPQPRHDYLAAIDPATRGNAWTLIVAGRQGRVKKIVHNQEWRGTPTVPLSPRKVIKEIKEICNDYGLNWVYTDQWAADAMRDIATEEGFFLSDIDFTQKEQVDTYTSLAAALGDRTVELPPDSQLLKDLKMVKKKPTNRGFSIVLPSTADGRHCDYVPALARALKPWIDDEKIEPPKPGDPEYPKHVEQKMLAEEEAHFFSDDEEEIVDDWEDFGDFENMMFNARRLSREF